MVAHMQDSLGYFLGIDAKLIEHFEELLQSSQTRWNGHALHVHVCIRV
jgi:hypothetical protein